MKRNFSAMARTAAFCACALLLALPLQALAEVDRREVAAALYALHQHQAELAELAEERAERDEIGALANTLRRNHGILAEWLEEAEEDPRSGEAGPAEAFDQEAHEALRQQEDEAFDDAYLAYQARLHQAAIAYLERNLPAEAARMNEFNNHLMVTHETLHTHLALIERLSAPERQD